MGRSSGSFDFRDVKRMPKRMMNKNVNNVETIVIAAFLGVYGVVGNKPWSLKRRDPDQIRR